jgi:cytochrome b subunit of formate dehydrogenase
MSPRARTILVFVSAAVLLWTAGLGASLGQVSNEDCLMCHEDPDLESDDGRSMYVSSDHYSNSVHGFLSCTDCHGKSADYWSVPHFDVYKPVDCSSCHAEAVSSFQESFHGIARQHGMSEAPDCSACHGKQQNPHRITSLSAETSETACQRCHTAESKAYDGSVHHEAAQEGKHSPGCTSCHPTHSKAEPPSVGAVNRLCESCHQGSMEAVRKQGHFGAVETGGVMACASCHDVHGAHRPEIDQGTLQACQNCHPEAEQHFEGSVHEALFEAGMMNCLSCHKAHHVTGVLEKTGFGCGNCHEDAEGTYRDSVHRKGRLAGDEIAADCADCHGGHHVLHPEDEESPVNRAHIPRTCGGCHGGEPVITVDYVRLPVSLPNYLDSVHGRTWKGGGMSAVCTDCHGDHDLKSASAPDSSINAQNLTATCGQCHAEIADRYAHSVHGKALAHGISDAPTCTECHDEHLILPTESEACDVSFAQQSQNTCGRCHEDPEMAARYGMSSSVVEGYEDSYHGWAVGRDCGHVAVCSDCHNAHEIRSPLDPVSSVHPANVVGTCGRCHENSNPEFAQSYSHVTARGALMPHDYVRFVYIGLIVLVLGGMVAHNGLIFGRDLQAHYRWYHGQPTVKRMNVNEVIQHMVLAITFIGLAITGFALRFPETWWAVLLENMGMNEQIRRILHRVLGTGLILVSLYHMVYMIATQRGRWLTVTIFPRWRDVREAVQNVAYYLGLRKEPPHFHRYDYTQKAEYWALVWGTFIMAVTGIILWYPDVVTGFLPAWSVRVAETIHFYEAILAVGAIVIWHFFFTIFWPKEYPMSWSWITGRMTKHHWQHHHADEAAEYGEPARGHGDAPAGGAAPAHGAAPAGTKDAAPHDDKPEFP